MRGSQIAAAGIIAIMVILALYSCAHAGEVTFAYDNYACDRGLGL